MKYGDQSILAFIDEEQITNDQGEPLDFYDHPFLASIYRDFSPFQVIKKAAQIGFSTMANIKALWMAKYMGLDIIYTLPSADDVRDFVASKTNRLIANNPIFQQWTADKDSIEQKRVGNNVIHFRGTWTERGALAIPADAYISDETDRSKAVIVKQYQTRLQHSKFGYQWYFSNPSVPGHGVDLYWGDSDQKEWMVKCDHCGTWQPVTMASIQGNIFGCIKCTQLLERRHGEWVKSVENATYSGYHIPLLIAPWVSAKYVLDKQKEYSEEQFANFVLGEPYVGRKNVLTRQAFFQNLTPDVNSQGSRMVIGVDTGVGINLVCGNQEGLFYYDKSENYDKLKALLKANPTAIAVIDQGGDIIGPRQLREEFPGRVFLCFFRRDRKNDQLVQWSDKDGTVTADRNKLIQLVVDEFTERRIPLNGTESEWYDVWLEWQGMYRTLETSDVGPDVHEWHKPSSGRCDYPFAMVYWRVGMDRFATQQKKGVFVDPAASPSFGSQGIDLHPLGRRFMPR